MDLSDAEDVKVITNDPGGEVLVHLGSSNYLDRFKIYVAHLREWRQQFDKLESVDLRYEHQIIVNPDLRGAERQPPLSASAARAAISAGVKPAALVNRERTSGKSASAHAVVVKPVATKQPEKQSRWHKHRVSPKHRAAKPAAQAAANPAPAVSKSQAKPALQKPSPAIAKGQGKP